MLHDGDTRRALVLELFRIAQLADVGLGGGASAPHAHVVDIHVAALDTWLVGFGGGAPYGEF